MTRKILSVLYWLAAVTIGLGAFGHGLGGGHALGLGRRAREVADGGLMGYGPDDRPLVMLVSLLVARGAGALGVSSHHAIALARRAVLLTLGALCVVAALNAQGLELRFLDVGQGDALLVRESGKTALIDAGPSGDVVGRLRALGIDTIDLAVASHNHSDHIGGMAPVLSQLVVRYYMDNGIAHTTTTYRLTLQAVQTTGAQYLP